MNRRPLIGKILAFTLVTVALIGIGMAWQFSQMASARPGEETLRRYAPETTSLALTLDLKPSSFEQGQALQRIQTALKQEQLDTRIPSSLHKWTKDVPIVQGLLPYLSGSGAILAWPKPNSAPTSNFEPDVVAIVGVSSDKEATAVLQRNAEHTTTEDGQTYYHIAIPNSHSDLAATLSDHNVLVGEPAALQQVFATRKGKTPALAKNSTFTSLRKLLPADANMLYYMSPNLMRQVLNRGAYTSPENEKLLQNIQPACFAATLRQSGVQLDSVGSGNPSYMKPIQESAALNLRPGLPIPQNPLGFFVLSQPGKYFEAYEQTVQSISGEVMERWNRGVADWEKQTRIRVHEDILPALSGNLTVAAYPGAKPDTIDLLFLTDTNHDANPAKLADLLRDSMERSDHRLTFTSQSKDQTTLWTLPEPLKVSSLNWSGGMTSDMVGPRIAQVDNAVVFATSSDLLNRAVDAYHKSPATPLDLLRIPADSRSVVVLEPKRILDLLTPHLKELQTQNSAQTTITSDDFTGLFGDSPFVASMGVHDSYMITSTQIPLHYETAVKLASKLWTYMDKSQEEWTPSEK